VTTITFATNSARYIRVTQTGSVGGLWWSIHEFNVFGTIGTLPAVPNGLTAVAGDGEVALTWNSAANATSYNLKQGDNQRWALHNRCKTDLPVLTYTNTGLVNERFIYFVVSAKNPFGESTNSIAVSVRPVSVTSPQLNFTFNSTPNPAHLGPRITSAGGSKCRPIRLALGWGRIGRVCRVPLRQTKYSFRLVLRNGSVFSGWFIPKVSRVFWEPQVDMPDTPLSPKSKSQISTGVMKYCFGSFYLVVVALLIGGDGNSVYATVGGDNSFYVCGGRERETGRRSDCSRAGSAAFESIHDSGN